MPRLRASDQTVALGHMGAVFLYHQRYGYILEMSRDVHDLWAAFKGGADRVGVETLLGTKLSGQSASELVDILCEFSCLEQDGAPDDDKWIDYVPVKGAWNVWERADDTVSLWTAWGEREVTRHALSAEETAVWDAIDGELRICELAARFGNETTLPLMERLTSLEVQAVKLSPMPLSVFGGRRKWPPYLTSTMPYGPLKTSRTAEVPALDSYHADIGDADAQFDDVETTLAHLFRRPHIALADRTYGAALLDGLEKHGLVLGPEPLRVIEIGGGLGEVAASFVSAARVRGYKLDYRIVELSPALAARQRERTAGLGVEVIEADALEAPIEAGSVNLLIVNEMIGDLAVSPLSAAGELVARFELDVEGATAETPINTGALDLVEKAASWLSPGAMAVMTEFGERMQFARLSSHLDHPEHSIHFGHLETAATALGLAAEFVYVIDLIEMNRELKGLATTRSQFRALRGLLAAHGVTLDKIGYTAEMFAELTAPLDVSIGDFRFERIEDRLMGLVPHEFKALILRRA